MYFSEGYSIVQYMTAGALFLLLKETTDHLPKWLLRLAGSLSKRTVGIYLIHVLFLDICSGVMLRLRPALSPSLRIVYSFLVVSAASVCAAYILSKIPLLRRLV